jgi:hypothetical protein
MTKKHTLNKTFDKDYLITLRIPLSLHSKFDEWKNLRSLPLGKEGRARINKIIIDMLFKETDLFNKELLKEVDKLFIEGTITEKLRYIVDFYFEIKQKMPYLTTQQLITTESAGFLPLECVVPFYWEDKFLCFQCIIKGCPVNLPRLSLKDTQGHRITVKIATPDFCERCVTICKKAGKGLSFFGNITLEQLEIYRETRKQRKTPKHELSITRRLQQGGVRSSKVNARQVKILFANMNKRKGKWKDITKAMRAFEKQFGKTISRPTIYKLIEIFPEGLPVKE